jgi:hypothetical protein
MIKENKIKALRRNGAFAAPVLGLPHPEFQAKRCGGWYVRESRASDFREFPGRCAVSFQVISEH